MVHSASLFTLQKILKNTKPAFSTTILCVLKKLESTMLSPLLALLETKQGTWITGLFKTAGAISGETMVTFI